jgi:hypothetical protein
METADSSGKLDGWTCSGCGAPIDGVDGPDGEHATCSRCGDRRRTAHYSVVLSAKAEVYLKVRHKSPGHMRKPHREVIQGDEFFRRTGRWSTIYRLFDRVNDWYEEVIWDRETGAIIYQKAEPLSEHRNQSAKHYGR